jgi:hypothetical protein
MCKKNLFETVTIMKNQWIFSPAVSRVLCLLLLYHLRFHAPFWLLRVWIRTLLLMIVTLRRPSSYFCVLTWTTESIDIAGIEDEVIKFLGIRKQVGCLLLVDRIWVWIFLFYIFVKTGVNFFQMMLNPWIVCIVDSVVFCGTNYLSINL